MITRTQTVLRERSSLVTQQIFDPSKFFWECTGADDRTWNLAVRHNLLCVYRFAHVKVDAETFGGKLDIDIEVNRRKMKVGVQRKMELRWETHLIGIIDEKRIKNLNT